MMNKKEKLVNDLIEFLDAGCSLFVIPALVFNGVKHLIPGSEWYETLIGAVVAFVALMREVAHNQKIYGDGR